MRNLLKWLIGIFVCIPFLSFSQAQIPLQLISTAGDISKSNGVSVDWSLGEPIADLAINDAAFVNQGFQQNHFSNINLGTFSTQIEDLNVEVYPNPTSEYLMINFEQNLFFNIDIFSISGFHILHSHGQTGINRIELSTLDSGTYLLKLSRKNQQLYQQLFIKI